MKDPFPPGGPVPPAYREVPCICPGDQQSPSPQQALANQPIGSPARNQRRTRRIPRRPAAPVTRKPAESREAFLRRHGRKCQVCRHTQRDEIEDAFVMWRRPIAIAEVFQLTGDSLYRHAVAFDLYARRRHNFRSVLDNIMERGVETDVTGETILGAVRAYACLTDDNRWIDPTSNVVFSTRPAASPAPPIASVAIASLPAPALSAPEPGEPGEPLATNHPPLATASDRGGQELKIDVTP